MDRCFVIQPFDGGPFDKRYDEVFAPAIKAAGLDPYRVDRDPKVEIPIEDIEGGIRNSRVCVAEITLDNPNVWFELGFALAANKDVVLVASESRPKFPFDVQHRKVVRYKSDSPGDFERLAKEITARLKGILEKQANLLAVSSPVADDVTAGQSGTTISLSAHEMAALVVIGTESLHGGSVTYSAIRQSMLSAGFTETAAAVALKSLLRRDLVVEKLEYSDDYPGESPWSVYRLTETGEEWMLANQDKLQLRIDEGEVPQI